MSRPVIIPDLPVPRPETKAEMVERIREVYRLNDWDGDERQRHQAAIGLEGKFLVERDEAELRRILDDFEAARMVIFRKDEF